MPAPATSSPYTIAIVGRPNVGKSTIFNRLTGTRRALVHDNPGVTRDRIYGEGVIAGRAVRLIDTGGIYEDKGLIPEQIEKQAQAAMGEAGVILMVCDIRAGLTGGDLEMAGMLRKRGTPWILVANKSDTDRLDALAGELHHLGADAVIPFSAEHGRGHDDLEEAIEDIWQASSDAPEESAPRPKEREKTGHKNQRELRKQKKSKGHTDFITGDNGAAASAVPDEVTAPFRVAIVGRPNVGKSSLLNRLLGYERAIVLDLPGTTRDTVDTALEAPAGKFLLVDTAGIRRKSSTDRGEEVLSVVMAQKAIEAAEVCLLVIDAEAGITHQDATIAGLVEKAHRAIAVLVNKYDRIAGDKEKCDRLDGELKERLRFMAHAPLLKISALNGDNVAELLPLAARLARRFRKRLPTRDVNDLLPRLLAIKSIPLVGGREYKIKYMTQPQSSPPFFVFFTNRDFPPPTDYQRFLENRLREMTGCDGVPVILKFKSSKKK
jgi:GTP-binding protein